MPEIINPILKATTDAQGNPIVQPNQPVQVGNLPSATPSLSISTGNPALKSLFENTNKMLQDYAAQGGTLTPEIQQRIQAINDAELQKQGSVAGARTAADNKDAPTLDTHITTANTAETTQQSELQSLLGEMKTARQNYIGSLAPTQAETDLQTKLNTLRTERQLLPIELRQEGISAPGIGGRQIEDERVRTIQEQNLLLEIGLKQDARKMTSGAYKDQIGFIQNDIDLQQKIQDKLDKQEQQLVENARNLNKDSLSALSNIVDSLKGLAWTDLDPQTQSDISNLLKNYPDLTPQIVADALKIGKQQQIFENAIKAGKVGGGADKILSPTEATALGVPYGTTQSEAFGKTPQKPATAAQQTVATYTSRIEQSQQTLKSLENSIAGMNYLRYQVVSRLPSTFQGSEFQQYDQASRNFINAVLRRESGAVISPSEFDNARKQYLPQPGDSKETLKQKELNRNIVFESFKKASGNAYTSMEDLLKGTSNSSGAESETYATPDGTEYIKGEDGLYYPK